MNVALYSHFFFPSIGGVEQATATLGSFLVQHGVDVTVLTQTRAADADHYDFPVLRRPRPSLMRRVVSWSDVVYTMGFSFRCAALASLHGKPLLWDHPDHDLVCPKNIAWDNGDTSFEPNVCRRCLARDWSPLYVAGLSISLRIRQWYARRTPLHVFHSQYAFERARTAVDVLNGAVIPYFQTSNRPLTTDWEGESARTFAFLGRLIPEKGCAVAIEAFANVDEATLVVIGEGWYRGDLERLATELEVEDKVKFVGALPHDAALQILASCRALIVPSLWGEPFGQVALEAMSLGVPVLASDAGALPEVVGGYGRLFPKGNSQALEEEMKSLLCKAGLAEEISSKGKEKYAAVYDPDSIGNAYLKMLQTTVAGRGLST